MIYFILILFVIIFAFAFFTRKYRNPYKLFMVFGKKGSGKSTFLVKQGVKYLKKGYTVYTNMSECLIKEFRYIDIEDIGEHITEPKSVLLVDEVGMIWDNRNFRAFKPSVRDYFKLQRHYKTICYLASQTFDVDKKLRDLCDGMYLCIGCANVLSVAKRIVRKVVLTESVGDQESRISENLKFAPLWNWCFTWIPKYAKFYDSFEAPELPAIGYKVKDGISVLVERNVSRALKKATSPSIPIARRASGECRITAGVVADSCDIRSCNPPDQL